MTGTEVLPLFISCLNNSESTKSLQVEIPTNTAGAIHRCNITPCADAEITSHSVRAYTTFTDSWDDAAFINIYAKRKRHGIISRALLYSVLKRGRDLF